jgi:hypothetical protein
VRNGVYAGHHRSSPLLIKGEKRSGGFRAYTVAHFFPSVSLTGRSINPREKPPVPDDAKGFPVMRVQRQELPCRY